MMKKYFSALLATVAMAVMASSAQATVITSGTFDLGFGYTANGVWDTTETSGANTAVTGPFTITVTPVTTNFTSRGPTFPGRVLTNGNADGFLAASEGSLFTVTAEYTGGLAGEGATPLTLVIESISIQGYNLLNFTNVNLGVADEINFSETTAGNVGASPVLNLLIPFVFGSEDQASNFNQLVWNPGETAVSGTISTRTFAVIDNITLGGGNSAGIDGFEIVGRVEFNTVAIPEPSTLSLAGISLIGLFGYGRRRKG